jgi:uncharacterized LabA/DUF88 family protein
MPLFGGAYTGPQEVHYLFVDGGALRGRLNNVSQRLFNGQTFNINFVPLAQEFTKVFYYDALPVREERETESDYHNRIKAQREMLDSAAGIDKIHVYEGDARRRRKFGLQQKKVDVMITVDMLTHSFRRNMHRATLLTGDNDFKPLLDALVQEGMFTTLWYPPDETSTELLNAADSRRRLDIQQLRRLLTEESKGKFVLPAAVNQAPDEPEPGIRVKEWEVDGVHHSLNKDGADLVLLREGDALNRLHVRHNNIDVLRCFCKEVLEIELPPI